MSSPFSRNIAKKNFTKSVQSDPKERVKAKTLKKGKNNSKSANAFKKQRASDQIVQNLMEERR
jgi:hypothetical protein